MQDCYPSEKDEHWKDDFGVWVGIQQMEYGNLASEYVQAMGAYTATGTPFSVAAGRLSFTFGFKGPAVCNLAFHITRMYDPNVVCVCMHMAPVEVHHMHNL